MHTSWSGSEDHNSVLLKFGNYPPTGTLGGLRFYHNSLVSEAPRGRERGDQRYRDMLLINKYPRDAQQPASLVFQRALRHAAKPGRPATEVDANVVPEGSTNLVVAEHRLDPAVSDR